MPGNFKVNASTWFFLSHRYSDCMRLLIFLFWLIFGSLGSVLLTRFADGVTRTKLRGFFFWNSQCPHCHHRLTTKNLIPLVSYLVQWGKCEYCRKKISRIYPVLELLCAGIFVATYFLLKNFWTPILIFWLLTNRLLILLLVYDLQKYELHMIARILLTIAWILANFLLTAWNLRYAFLTAVLFGGVFTGIYFFAKRYAKMRFNQTEWFGEGDIYVAVTIWIIVPIVLSLQWIIFSRWTIMNVLILFVLMSSIIGLIWSGFQYIFQKIFHNSEFWTLNSKFKVIPFFPAMIIAFWILAWKIPYFITLIFW